MSYGYCPNCGAPGERRERRPNGNDTCANGCVYPSKDALKTQDEYFERDTQAFLRKYPETCNFAGFWDVAKQENAPGWYRNLEKEVVLIQSDGNARWFHIDGTSGYGIAYLHDKNLEGLALRDCLKWLEAHGHDVSEWRKPVALGEPKKWRERAEESEKLNQKQAQRILDLENDLRAIMKTIGHDDLKTVAEQVGKEWQDFMQLASNATKVYEHFSGLTKPLSDPEYIIAYATDRENERVDEAIKDFIEPALDLLNDIREHHERLNREAGRPLERSNTIRMVKEVIAALTREDKPQALTDVERSVGILKRWISDRIDRVRADAIEKINAENLDLSPERNTEEALLKLRHDLEREWNR